VYFDNTSVDYYHLNISKLRCSFTDYYYYYYTEVNVPYICQAVNKWRIADTNKDWETGKIRMLISRQKVGKRKLGCPVVKYQWTRSLLWWAWVGRFGSCVGQAEVLISRHWHAAVSRRTWRSWMMSIQQNLDPIGDVRLMLQLRRLLLLTGCHR